MKWDSTHRISYNRFIVQMYNVTNQILALERILNAVVSWSNYAPHWLPFSSVFYRLSNPFSGVSGSSTIALFSRNHQINITIDIHGWFKIQDNFLIFFELITVGDILACLNITQFPVDSSLYPVIPNFKLFLEYSLQGFYTGITWRFSLESEWPQVSSCLLETFHSGWFFHCCSLDSSDSSSNFQNVPPLFLAFRDHSKRGNHNRYHCDSYVLQLY